MNSCDLKSLSPISLLLFLFSNTRSSSTMVCDFDSIARRLLRECAIREFNAFLWVLLIAVTAVLVREVVRLCNLWIQGSRIPGPPCPSFFGHCKLISRENLTGLHEKYGSVIKMWLGPTQLLVSIRDPELIREMLLKAEDKFPLTGRAFRLAFGRSSLFLSSFDKLVRERRESLAADLNKRLLDRASVVPSGAVDSIVERIQIAMAKGSVSSGVISQQMAFSMLGATLFGEAFLAWSKASIYEELLMSISKDVCFWASYNVRPFWKRRFWKYQSLCTKLKYLTQDLVQMCRKNYERLCHMDQKPCTDAASGSPLAPAYSRALMPDNLSLEAICSHLNTSEEPCANIMGVMFHGCLTTAGLISNVLARLATYPDIQDQIYSEMTSSKGSQNADQPNVDEMPLLIATIYESARLLPAWPLLQRCSLKHDLHLKSRVNIPAGAVIVVPVQLVQTDDSSWGKDANEFNPHRFLSSNQKGSPSVAGASGEKNARKISTVLGNPNDNAAFLPFGSGIRACVGQKFVIRGVATLFASLLKRYEIKLHPGSEYDMKPTISNCIIQLLPSPDIVFIERNS